MHSSSHDVRGCFKTEVVLAHTYSQQIGNSIKSNSTLAIFNKFNYKIRHYYILSYSLKNTYIIEISNNFAITHQ